MALINCPECGQQVAETALACPQCGAPIARGIVTTQETAKGFKMHILISTLFILVGIVWAIGAGVNSTNPVIPVVLIFAGLVWFLATRFRIWWHHK